MDCLQRRYANTSCFDYTGDRLPTKRVCRIVTLGGHSMDEWTDTVLSTLEDWAEAQACHAMETVCRKGFIKKIKKFWI